MSPSRLAASLSLLFLMLTGGLGKFEQQLQ
jgi:hypothetical protein